MDRKAEFRTIIEARSAEKQHAALSPSARQRWEKIRDERIRPVLADAAAAMRDLGISCGFGPKNGEAIELLVGHPGASSFRHITFTHREERIQMTSSEGALDEAYDVEVITEDDVAFKVGEFLKRIAP